MEHIPLPTGARHTVVPFISRHEYDKGPFLAYPLRTNPPRRGFLPLNTPGYDAFGSINELSKQDLDEFMQTWLFFGILWEFFGSDPSFEFEDFALNYAVCESSTPSKLGKKTNEVLFQFSFDEDNLDTNFGSYEATVVERRCNGPLCTGKTGDAFLRGACYQCTICTNVDICDECIRHPANLHNRTHPLMKLKKCGRSGIVHSGSLCGGPNCYSRPERTFINNVRYVCTVCPDKSFCTDCNAQHASGHDQDPTQVKVGKHVYTQCLPNLVKRWTAEFESLSQEEQESRRKHLNICLQVFEYVFISTRPGNIASKMDSNVRLSIGGLGEYLQNVLAVLKSSGTIKGRWNLDPTPGEIQSEMMINGYCTYEVNVLQHFKGLATAYYLSKLKPPGSLDTHKRCTETECIAFFTNPWTYETQHRSNNCTCGLFVAGPQEINKPLEAGSYPILRIRPSLAAWICEVEVVSKLDVDIPYVAISHVWADGMGNVQNTALYHCQLRYLYDRVAELMRCLNETAVELHIWIDTLCCPVAPKDMKDLGLARIREVYEKATHVLVVDKSIQQYRFEDITPLEASACIFMSPWSRRLWTLQEASLAKTSRLWFQFRDTLVCMEHLAAIAYHLFSNDPACRAIITDVGAPRYILTNSAQDPNPEVAKRMSFETTKLYHVTGATALRSVSNETDEPICLASLLGIDLNSILEHDALETRMKALLTTLASEGEMPQRVIFANTPRLSSVGHRWAPKTLLRRGLQPIFGPLDSIGVSTPLGLKVQCPAFRIRRRPPVSGFEAIPFETTSNYLLVRLSSEDWYRFKFMPLEFSVNIERPDKLQDLFKGGPGEIVTLFEEEPIDDQHSQSGGKRALIGELSSTSVVLSLMVGYVWKADGERSERAFQCSESLRASSLVARLAEFPAEDIEHETPAFKSARLDLFRKVLEMSDLAEQESETLNGPIAGLISRGLFSPFCTVEEGYNSGTEWYID